MPQTLIEIKFPWKLIEFFVWKITMKIYNFDWLQQLLDCNIYAICGQI